MYLMYPVYPVYDRTSTQTKKEIKANELISSMNLIIKRLKR